MFGTLQTECGYTPSQIEEMTLPEVQRLAAHWKINPPLRTWVAACAKSLGVNIDTASSKPKPMTEQEFTRWLQQTDGGRFLG